MAEHTTAGARSRSTAGASLVRTLDSGARGFDAALAALTAFDASSDPAIESAVATIIDDVRRDGDRALVAYTRRFDRMTVRNAGALEITRAELAAAWKALGAIERRALQAAHTRIRDYHERQVSKSWQFTDEHGSKLGQLVRPLDRAGLYVPGGKAAYPSSLLMNAVPAKVAGVRDVVMVVPTPGGERNTLVLAAAKLAGVDRAFTIGGAQAVAALAYGTATVPAVDKITGPGNAYVAAAKRRVFGTVGIDMIAGPSEILVIADDSANPDWIAMDLFSQAEHDEMAQSILLTPSLRLLTAVHSAIARLLPGMARREVIAKSLASRGALVRVKSLAEACAIADRIAPEHLELSVRDPRPLVERIRHAGAIFVGHYTSETLGDYCAGSNHVLPTARTARFSSPLGVYDFQKRTSVIEVTPRGADALGGIASVLARAEGLEAHARAAECRLKPKRRGAA
ncbi:MAG: histidinol dehydrogenase [Rhodocyclaceae bacterium]|jgi:histidinol dehydrogenase|nr:histidinol dehydrogenase [Rhodocyclaceae bacterium]MCE2980165.1 histidinol dehydrogenase [Betaproteobacteria bacterium]MCA3073198.1 histidinol dehydrogenase [Rhodocyclaceae bacterium]MCA3090616.1 histidinol dehydrogenase [Rhodocyclaceae bacterium]MCA3094842.1 histidinol dehydrogenase [Rhodocyclaceae bacterium]